MRFSAEGAGDPTWDFPRTVVEAATVLGGPILVPENFDAGWIHEIHSEGRPRALAEPTSISGVTVRVVEPMEADFTTIRLPLNVDLSSTMASVLIGHLMNRSSPVTDVPTVRSLGASAYDHENALILDREYASGAVVEFGPYEGAAVLVGQFVLVVAGAIGIRDSPLVRTG